MASVAPVASFLTLVTFLLCGVLDVVECNGSHRHMKPHLRKEHSHYVPMPPPDFNAATPVRSILREDELLQDPHHLEEHLRGVFSEEQVLQMTPKEREFHYFKLHDDDDNNLLDGLEMLNAIGHVLEHDADLELGSRNAESLSPEEAKKLQNAQLQYKHQMMFIYIKVDRMLAESDKNNDGYISYAEYVNARRGAQLS